MALPWDVQNERKIIRFEFDEPSACSLVRSILCFNNTTLYTAVALLCQRVLNVGCPSFCKVPNITTDLFLAKQRA